MTNNRRYVESAAIVSGSPAWLISRILASPRVRDVLASPPRWIERSELAATVTAIHQAARAFETACAASERDNRTTVSATLADSSAEWTTAEVADYLQISKRRAQEIAADLGGYRAGRQWRIPPVAVREYARRRAA